MTLDALARAIAIRKLWLDATAAGDKLTAAALGMAMSAAAIQLGREDLIAYLLYVEATRPAPTAIPVETSRDERVIAEGSGN